MTQRQYDFIVNVDTASAQRAARQLQGIFQGAMGNVKVGVPGTGRGVTSAGGMQAGGAGGGINMLSLLSGNMRGVAGGFAAGAAVLGIKKLTDTIVDLGSTGAEIVRLTRSFDQLSAAIGINADTLTTKMRDAVQGTVTDYDMLSRANLLLVSAQQGALKVNEDQIAVLARFARLRSTQLTQEGKNLSTEEAFSRLIRGIAKRETELLDELGISSKQMADILGISVKEVNSSVQSMLDSVLAVASADVAKFGDPILDEATKIEQANTRIKMAMQEIQQTLATPAAIISEFGADVVDAIMNVPNLYRRLFAPENIDLNDLEKMLNDGLAKMKLDPFASPGVLGRQSITSNQQIKAIEQMLDAVGTLNRAVKAGVPGADELKGRLADMVMSATQMAMTPDMLQGWEIFKLLIGDIALDMELMALNSPNADQVASAIDAANLAVTKKAIDEQAEAVTKLNNALQVIEEAGAAGATGLDKIRVALLEIAEQALATGNITSEQMNRLAGLTGLLYNTLPGNLKSVYGPQMRRPPSAEPPTSFGKSWQDWMNGELGPTMEDHYKDATRAAEAAAKASQRAFESAAAAAAAAWKEGISKIPGIPGVTGASKVTQEDLDKAKSGLGVDFVDDFTRRMNDELVNGVDWSDISVEMVKQIISATRGIPLADLEGVANTVLAQMATEDISSGAVFGTEFGRQITTLLINEDALIKDARYQGLVQIGTQYVSSYVQEVLTAAGVNFANTENPLSKALINEFVQPNSNIAAQAILGIDNQFKDQKAIESMQSIGRAVGQSMNAGFEKSILDQPWAQQISAAIIADILRNLQEQFNN